MVPPLFRDAPADVIALCFGAVAVSPRDLGPLRCVCRRWKAIADSDAVWADMLGRAVGNAVGLRPAAPSESLRVFYNRLFVRAPAAPLESLWTPLTRVVSGSEGYRVDFDTESPLLTSYLPGVRPSERCAVVGIVEADSSPATPAVAGQLIAATAALDLTSNLQHGFTPGSDDDDDLVVEASPPALEAFACCPLLPGTTTRILALRLAAPRHDMGSAARMAYARQVQFLFGVCSNLVVAHSRATSLDAWHELVSPSMTTARCVPGNAFSTNESMAAVTYVSTADTEDHPLPRLARAEGTEQFKSWLTFRAGSVRSAHVGDNAVVAHLRQSAFRVPAWISRATQPLSAGQALMFMRELLKGDTINNLESAWSHSVALALYGHRTAGAVRFYREAMQVEIEDGTRAGAAFLIDPEPAAVELHRPMERLYATDMQQVQDAERAAWAMLDEPTESDASDADEAVAEPPVESDPVPALSFAPRTLPVPLELDELTETQERFYFAALRQCIGELVASGDVSGGTALLEQLKTELGGEFRDMWYDNQMRSRDYCRHVFDTVVIQPLQRRFLSDPEGLAQRGPKPLYAATRASFEEYTVKSRGGRRYDVLFDSVSLLLLPLITEATTAAAATLSGDLADTLVHDMELLKQSLAAEVVALQKDQRSKNDRNFSSRQYQTALLTVRVGVEWTATSLKVERGVLQDLLPAATRWEMFASSRGVELGVFGAVDTPSLLQGFRDVAFADLDSAARVADNQLSCAAQNTASVRENAPVSQHRSSTSLIVRLFDRFR